MSGIIHTCLNASECQPTWWRVIRVSRNKKGNTTHHYEAEFSGDELTKALDYANGKNGEDRTYWPKELADDRYFVFGVWGDRK